MNGTKLWQEFKGFALKGNVIDLAVAVVIGGAFGSVVKSLAENIIMPAISYVVPSSGSYHEWHLGKIEIGTFLGALVNFLVIALAMFLIMVKLLDALKRAKLIPAGPPAHKQCPLCLSSIPVKARKCAFCTADLPADPEALAPPAADHSA